LLLVHAISSQAEAGLITFGSGGSSFSMEFVTIGDAGNAADTGSAPTGSVSYEYDIGKYEVSRSMIDSYNTLFGTSNNLQISMNDAYGTDGNKAALGLSWVEAARFVNWLNTSEGYSAAYKFDAGSEIGDLNLLWTSSDAGYDPTNPFRNTNAAFTLPTADEWYKAAYFDPVSDTWRQYATLNGNEPTATTGSTADNEVVYKQTAEFGPVDVTLAGGVNAFGVVGMNGNVSEWEETNFSLTNNDPNANRGFRGGYWNSSPWFLRSDFRGDRHPKLENNPGNGLRVTFSQGFAPVPEPSSLAIFAGIAIVSVASRKRKRARR
jgi:sulfatase modifying factor 1